jgi:hypothetical protein
MAKVLKLKNNEVYQLKITLNYVRPVVWRRIFVNSDVKLPDLHKIIQTTMGWTNSHLHQFIKGDKFYSEPDDESFEENIDYRKIRLHQILTKEKQSVVYEYDFGDGWAHKIVLEKILSNQKIKYPICIDGKGNCPPEDCGGPGGYEDLLKIISDSENDGYDEMMDWLGDEFDPDYFDSEAVNEMLQQKDYGCITLD